MNDLFSDLVLYISQHTSFAVGIGFGWFAHKLMGRIWSLYYSVKRLGRL